MFRPLLQGACLLLAGLAATSGPVQAQGSGSATIDAIRARGQLICGVPTGVPGFALPDSQGVMRGIEADYCRAIAAAVLGDGNKVRFVPLNTTVRFTALQSGEIDVLSRNTTWTLAREANLGLQFAGINFYDGTGFMVKTSMGVTSAKGIDGATICIQPGTSTELAIADYFRANNMKFTPVLGADLNELQNTFVSGRCDVYSTDTSGLAAFRAQTGKPADYALLPEIISKEPLGPIVRKGDARWFDLVRWTHFGLLIAEENGITQANVEAGLKSANPDVRRLLGVEGDLGKALGVDNRFVYAAVKQVGNYGEIWERNITPLGVPRGINNLWNKGGLQYPPPMR